MNRKKSDHYSMSLELAYSSTKQPFLMHEVIEVARCIAQGLDRQAILNQVYENNLLQAKARATQRTLFTVVYNRLKNAPNAMIEWIAAGPSDLARSSNLCLLLIQSRLLRELIEESILENFLLFQTQVTKAEITRFFERKHEQIEAINAWTESTLFRTQNYLTKTLVDAKLLSGKSPEWQIEPQFVPAPLRALLLTLEQGPILNLMLDRSVS